MDTDLHTGVAALAELRNADWHAIVDAANNALQIAPGLLAWIEGASNGRFRTDLDRPELARLPPVSQDI